MIKVAVDAPLYDSLTYLEHDEFEVTAGDWVTVPLGKRQTLGLVVATNIQEKPAFELKKIISKSADWPKLNASDLEFLKWISDYYLYPIGQTAMNFIPTLLRAKKNRSSQRPPVIPDLKLKPKPELTGEQAHCLSQINIDLGFQTHLVHGVTGSGKTEIYLRLFEKCIEKNKKGLFLVPEISLTPQLVNRFVERFGDQVAVLHSQLTDRERSNQWFSIIDNEKKILIGARSALFCPIENLGLIVVDEEHESSFKQDEKLKYNGRDAAVVLGKIKNCPVILGSATPSLESWKNAVDQKYNLHSLKSRVANRALPNMNIVDMRLEKENVKRKVNLPFWLSQDLFEFMQNALSQNQQSALLLNRRGMANLVFCRNCGYSAECPNCDVSLILHGKHHLVCHYCDYHENYSLKCPDCSDGELAPMGLGTEKIEEDIKLLFPQARVARADRDEISTRIEMENLIESMETGNIDILIGTQMIAKGLDFPKLSVVGLVLADVGFNLPDFRATEKSFQLILQMSGRSGRHETAGNVVVQTYNPDHESIIYAKKHDYLGFVENELKNREPLRYPPFNKLVAFRISSMDQKMAKQTSEHIQKRAIALIEKYNDHYAKIEVLGPAAAPLAKLNNQYRMHLLLKGPTANALNHLVKQILGDQKWIQPKVKVVVDVDPMNLL